MVPASKPVDMRAYPNPPVVSEQLLSLILLAAFAVFLLGFIARLIQYWRLPVPFNIPIMPAPKSRLGVFGRLLGETVLFKSLFLASKWTWVFGWSMHLALLLLLGKHLFYVYTVPPLWVAWLMSIGHWLFALFLFGLFGLLMRRIDVQRVRMVSAPSDYLMLLLLIAIAVSGYSMHAGAAVNVVEVKYFVAGLLSFEWRDLPADWRLVVHLLLVSVLLLIFPFSKLLHAPGLFFAPTLNQVDDTREGKS